MHVLTYLIAYLLLLNLIGFVLMAVDKYRAKKRAFRIPEATLFIVAIIGGSIGCVAGMHIFRHKTRHWYFLYGMPVILILQLLSVLALLFYAPIEFKVI